MKIDPKWLTIGLSDEQVKGAVIVGWRAVLVFHIAWACGWASYIGMGSGFAYAGDVTRVRDDVSSIKVELLEQRIFDTRLRQCQTSAGPRSFYREKLQELMRKYRELTAADYRLPACEEL